MTIEEYRPESDEKNVSTPSIVSLDDKTTNASHISNAAQENVDDYIAKFLDMSNTAKA